MRLAVFLAFFFFFFPLNPLGVPLGRRVPRDQYSARSLSPASTGAALGSLHGLPDVVLGSSTMPTRPARKGFAPCDTNYSGFRDKVGIPFRAGKSTFVLT